MHVTKKAALPSPLGLTSANRVSMRDAVGDYHHQQQSNVGGDMRKSSYGFSNSGSASENTEALANQRHHHHHHQQQQQKQQPQQHHRGSDVVAERPTTAAYRTPSGGVARKSNAVDNYRHSNVADSGSDTEEHQQQQRRHQHHHDDYQQGRDVRRHRHADEPQPFGGGGTDDRSHYMHGAGAYDTGRNTSSTPMTTVPSAAAIRVDKRFLHEMHKKYKYKISANVSGTKFDVVKNVIEAIGCKILPDDNFDCNLIWDDTRVSVEGISELRAFQRYNHFPAMSEISKKDALARNILKMHRAMPHEFDFVPRTWIMPGEYSSLQAHALEMRHMQQAARRTYILKPANGAMGHGIRLYRNVEKIQPSDNYIVQEYIARPYLLDGFKFDLRIYALVTSCDPLRAFIYNNGLVRLGTEEYQEPNEANIDHLYMHLTNYSVNKRNKQHYDKGADTNGESGSKRSLKYLFEHFSRNSIDASKVWKSIQDIILKTLLVAEPYLFHTYKMCRPGQIPGTESVCFEILGFDILLDEKLKPWVLEVNRCPSFGANQQIDFDIKSRLLVDSLELLHLRGSDRQRTQLIEKAEAKRRLYSLNSYTNKSSDVAGINGSGPGGATATSESTASRSNLSTLATGTNSSVALTRKYKSKEKRKLELIDQIKLLRREQRRQEYENRNLGNYSRLFPIDDKLDMNFYLNILSTAFNLFYPVGKHLLWKKTYDRIKEDQLLNELAECDEDVAYNQTDYEQTKKINEYLKDDYMSTDTEEETHSGSDDEYERRRTHAHRGHHHHHGSVQNQNHSRSHAHNQRQQQYHRRDDDDNDEDSHKSAYASYGEHVFDSERQQQQQQQQQQRSRGSDDVDDDDYNYDNDDYDPKYQPASTHATQHHRQHHHHHHDHGHGQPQRRTSMATLIESENIKANRVSTLLNAAVGLYSSPASGAKATTATTTTTSGGGGKQQLTASERTRRRVDAATHTYVDKSIDAINANNELNSEATNQMLSQIRHHAALVNRQNGSGGSGGSGGGALKSAGKASTAAADTATLRETSEAQLVSGDKAAADTNAATLNIAVLKLLNQLEIKFPGKTTQQTKLLLQRINSKLEAYKPKLANYWMIKLDDTKRTKILNIVKSNLIVILQKVFMVDAVDSLRLYTIFVKLLNRMLWMHGQGLWNCFTSANNSSWEGIFNKSTFTISDIEMKCCYRVIELCKDCILVVYQYAFEQKPGSGANTGTETLAAGVDIQQHARSSSMPFNRFKNMYAAAGNLGSGLKSK